MSTSYVTHADDSPLGVTASADQGGGQQTITTVSGIWYRYVTWMRKISGSGQAQWGLSGIVTFPGTVSTSWLQRGPVIRRAAEASQLLRLFMQTNGDTIGEYLWGRSSR